MQILKSIKSWYQKIKHYLILKWYQFRAWTNKLLFELSMKLFHHTTKNQVSPRLLEHAYDEFNVTWPDWKSDPIKSRAVRHIIDAMTLISIQNSLEDVMKCDIITRLLKMYPLSALKFTNDEWSEDRKLGDRVIQLNKRCNRLYKEGDTIYDSQAMTIIRCGRIIIDPETRSMEIQTYSRGVRVDASPIMFDMTGNYFIGAACQLENKESFNPDAIYEFPCYELVVLTKVGDEIVPEELAHIFRNCDMSPEFNRTYRIERNVDQWTKEFDDYFKDKTGLNIQEVLSSLYHDQAYILNV